MYEGICKCERKHRKPIFERALVARLVRVGIAGERENFVQREGSTRAASIRRERCYRIERRSKHAEARPVVPRLINSIRGSLRHLALDDLFEAFGFHLYR